MSFTGYDPLSAESWTLLYSLVILCLKVYQVKSILVITFSNNTQDYRQSTKPKEDGLETYSDLFLQ